MTRNAICYVTNTTPWGYNPQDFDLMHGRTNKSPQDIGPNATNIELFSFYKTPGSMHGSTAHVQYRLLDNSMLYIAINCPFTQDGTSGYSNCYFYAGLIDVPSTGTLYTLDYTVEIGSSQMNPTDPPNADTVTANLTIYYNA
ncbi:hypothetical protein CLV59_1065 [Chitinophaga dinghuensis]|uniref:Uncharacterized protein n=1 Tax=Chitinophaga dinghuensis TaxID=1539050 RepID=A0A327VVL1_9BACT|nr:hypothetical protein [Chitinophaga dinghuensis]RAJ78946.1 hypothetical protein CLV59_1065 [Chitinophaga dinghuensis]